MKTHAIILMFISALLVSGSARAQDVDVTGKWDVSFNTGQEVIPALLTLTKQGDKLTGTIRDGRAPDRGEAPVEATLAEKKIKISFKYSDSEGPMDIVMDGTADKNTMGGTVVFGTRGQGDWTAKRPTAAAPAQSRPAGGDAKVDVSGTWIVSIATSSINATPTVVLKQEGEKLTGQYISTQYGSFPLEGTVKGNAITFAVSMSIEGNSLGANFKGTVENDSINGTMNYGDFAEGTFSAKKK